MSAWLGLLAVWMERELMCETGYKAHHAMMFPDPAVLKAHVDTYLTAHAALQNLQDKTMRAKALPDEDGFITVSRQGSRMGPASLGAAELAKAREDEKKKKAAKELDGFYRFQGREKRKEAEFELKRKFEEDRRKVENMRQKRMRTT